MSIKYPPDCISDTDKLEFRYCCYGLIPGLYTGKVPTGWQTELCHALIDERTQWNAELKNASGQIADESLEAIKDGAIPYPAEYDTPPKRLSYLRMLHWALIAHNNRMGTEVRDGKILRSVLDEYRETWYEPRVIAIHLDELSQRKRIWSAARWEPTEDELRAAVVAIKG